MAGTTDVRAGFGICRRAIPACTCRRLPYYVVRRCCSATIKEVAKELALDWHTAKELEKQYMRAQLARAETPGPKWIGINEISIRKRHTYRIVVSDLD